MTVDSFGIHRLDPEEVERAAVQPAQRHFMVGDQRGRFGGFSQAAAVPLDQVVTVIVFATTSPLVLIPGVGVESFGVRCPVAKPVRITPVFSGDPIPATADLFCSQPIVVATFVVED